MRPFLGTIQRPETPAPSSKKGSVHSLDSPFIPSLKTNGWFPAVTIKDILKPTMLASAILAVLKTELITFWPGP